MPQPSSPQNWWMVRGGMQTLMPGFSRMMPRGSTFVRVLFNVESEAVAFAAEFGGSLLSSPVADAAVA